MTFTEILSGFRDLLTKPFVLIWIVLAIAFVLVRRYLHIRRHKTAREEQIAALTPLANSLGGTVTGPDGPTTAWSAGVRGPLAHEVGDWFGKLFQRSKPQFDLALDFRRGPWHVRVTEASMRLAVATGMGVRWEQEHRIEVATVHLPPMRVTRPPRYDFAGAPVLEAQRQQERTGWVSTKPETVERGQSGWHPVVLRPPMGDEVFAFSSDPATASRLLDLDALHWLLEREKDLPLAAKNLRLTFESGLVYIVLADHVDRETLMSVVDTILGLLDRMPGVGPRHPAAA